MMVQNVLTAESKPVAQLPKVDGGGQAAGFGEQAAILNDEVSHTLSLVLNMAVCR
jgi:hypothetical protein